MPGDLEFARGRVSTPKGPLNVRWNVGNSSDEFEFRLVVDAPLATSGRVSVPVSSGNGTVLLDSIPVVNVTVAEDGYLTLEVSGGEHDISVMK